MLATLFITLWPWPFTFWRQGQCMRRSCHRVFVPSLVFIVPPLLFLLEHDQIHTVTDATDHSTHASATAGVGNKSQVAEDYLCRVPCGSARLTVAPWSCCSRFKSDICCWRYSTCLPRDDTDWDGDKAASSALIISYTIRRHTPVLTKVFLFSFFLFLYYVKCVIVLHCIPSDACKCQRPWHCIWLFDH